MTSTWTANRTWVAGEVVTAALLNQYLRDNLDWLKVRPYSTEQDFDGTIFGTTSNTWQDTGISSGSLTTTGGRVLVICFGTVGGDTTNNHKFVTLYEDGVNKGDASYGMQVSNQYNSAATLFAPFCICYITPTAPTAAAHEWKLYLRNNNNANTVTIATAFIAAFEIGL